MHKKEQMICREKAFGIICFFIQEKMFYNLEWKRARSMQEKEMALFFGKFAFGWFYTSINAYFLEPKPKAAAASMV